MYGGSHGGYLTAWLLGVEEHRDLFRCGVLWNAVVDLPSMVGTTDIPEWCAAEALGAPAEEGTVARGSSVGSLSEGGRRKGSPQEAQPTGTSVLQTASAHLAAHVRCTRSRGP